jgi:subtilisin family serine protease
VKKDEDKVIKAQEMEPIDCEEAIVSQGFVDYIVQYENNITAAMIRYNALCYQIINEKYAVLHTPLDVARLDLAEFDISITPRLLGPYGIASVEASGMLVFHDQPYLPLRGTGVIIGFVDTGIDYTHPAFVYEDNTTKILSIWDQTIIGNPPSNFQYGTEYTEDMINTALASPDPYEVVPSVDTVGHGTFLAGVAAGRYVEADNFVGGAPDSDIVMVKLKPGKDYLRELYLIRDDAMVYQDNDIMMGIKYLIQKAALYGRPLVICIGLGTNQGSHDGTAILEEYLANIANTVGYGVCVAAGNEANSGHHYMGHYFMGAPYEDVEIRVAPREKGFSIQLWAQAPDIYSIGILSPTGEFISRIPARIGTRDEIDLLLERTTINIEYRLIEERTGDELIMVRFETPTEGLWTIRVYGDVTVIGHYHIWLERDGWIDPDTQFLNSSPYMTITVPATNEIPLTVGAYNHRTNSIYIGSGRGLTRGNILKPEIVAPGVDVSGPFPNDQYVAMTGTSVATAHAAAASALLMQWGIVMGNSPNMDTRTIKKLLIRGATRMPQFDYPNREWGFGSLNVFNSFEIIRGRRFD